MSGSPPPPPPPRDIPEALHYLEVAARYQRAAIEYLREYADKEHGKDKE